MLTECGKPHAKVQVLTNPKVQGFEHAKQKLPGIIERYRHFDLILFAVDSDGKDRTGVFASLESARESPNPPLLCVAAVQEVETWLLAGHSEKLTRRWAEVRNDVSVKENVFAPFLDQYGDARRYGAGRDLLMNQALANYGRILQLCPELQELQDRIADLLA
jgi:hypothetical protein